MIKRAPGPFSALSCTTQGPSVTYSLDACQPSTGVVWGENKRAGITMDVSRARSEFHPEEPTYLFLPFVNPKSVLSGSGIGRLGDQMMSIVMALWTR